MAGRMAALPHDSQHSRCTRNIKNWCGALSRDRTGDLILTMDALYHLSYQGVGASTQSRTGGLSLTRGTLYHLSYRGKSLPGESDCAGTVGVVPPETETGATESLRDTGDVRSVVVADGDDVEDDRVALSHGDR